MIGHGGLLRVFSFARPIRANATRMFRAYWEVSGIKSCTRIIPEKHKTMTKCQANAGPTLKAVCHLCGSTGPMSNTDVQDTPLPHRHKQIYHGYGGICNEPNINI